MEGKQEEIELSPFGLGRGSIYPLQETIKVSGKPRIKHSEQAKAYTDN